MRQTDVDFARDLLTQAGLQPEEIAATPDIGLLVISRSNNLVAWIFDPDGAFLRFESDLRRVDE